MKALPEKFKALQDMGVGEFAHLNGSLESHLLAVYELLRGWGNEEYVCDAGLYHAVYGTQPMKKLGIAHKEYDASDRPEIRNIIGPEAEHLVYLYGACDRDAFYPQIGGAEPLYRDRFTGAECVLVDGDYRNLLELTLANELEICLSSADFMEKHREWFQDLFDRFEGVVSEAAFRGYVGVFR